MNQKRQDLLERSFKAVRAVGATTGLISQESFTTDYGPKIELFVGMEAGMTKEIAKDRVTKALAKVSGTKVEICSTGLRITIS
jgi:hypothetical protein